MTIKARPNPNGNTRNDFIEAYKDMTDLRMAIMTVRSSMSQNVIHGRNYSCMYDHANDMTRLRNDLNKMVDILDELQLDLFNAIQED